MTEPDQVALVNVEDRDLFKELVQGLVGVGDEKDALVGVVSVKRGNNLHGHVGFARPGRPHNNRKALGASRSNRLFERYS